MTTNLERYQPLHRHQLGLFERHFAPKHPSTSAKHRQTSGRARLDAFQYRHEALLHRRTSVKHRSKQPKTGLNRPLLEALPPLRRGGRPTPLQQNAFYGKHGGRGTSTDSTEPRRSRTSEKQEARLRDPLAVLEQKHRPNIG